MIGFSVRKDIINKATKEQATTLHVDWKWINDGTPIRLHRAICRGYAVTPAQWEDGYKSKYKGNFLGSQFVMLDFDGGLSLDEALNNDFIKSTACFLYTSPSHLLPGKGERFRIVWALSQPLYDWREMDDVIIAIRSKLGNVDDAAINAASCLFGNKVDDNDRFFSHVWSNYSNRIDPTPLIQQQEAARLQRRIEFASRGIADGEQWEADKDTCGEDRVALITHCLKQQPNGVRYVPDRLPNHQTYIDSWNALGGMVHYFGAELTLKIIEDADWWGDNSNGDWDVIKLVEDLEMREELWIPGDDKWNSYRTVLAIAKKDLGEHSPPMPNSDFTLFQYNTPVVSVFNQTVITEESTLDVQTASYSSLLTEVAGLLLSDGWDSENRATLLKSKIRKQFNLTDPQLNHDINRAAMTLIGIDLNGSSTAPNTNVDDSGWDLDDDFDEPIPYAIPGVLPEKGTAVLAGVGGTGKTTLAAQWSVAWVKGHGCVPHPEIPCDGSNQRVLFIATDQPTNAKRRIANDFFRCGVDIEWLKEHVKIVAADPKRCESAWTTTLKGLRRLNDMVSSGEFGLVVIDSFKAITSGTDFNHSDNQDVAMLIRMLMGIVNPHASLVIINHAADPSAKKIPNISEMQGATALGQMVDSVYIIRKPADGMGYRELYGVKIRDGNEGYRVNYTHNFEECRMEVLPNSLSPEATMSDRILKCIDEHAKPAISSGNIAKHLGMDVQNVYNYMTRAHAAKLVAKKGNGWRLTAKGKRHLDELLSNIFSVPHSEPADF